jgi:hypothetical protein
MTKHDYAYTDRPNVPATRVAHAEQLLKFIGGTNEIRGPQDGPPAGGIFRNHNLAARYALRMNTEGYKIYFTLNPVDTTLFDVSMTLDKAFPHPKKFASKEQCPTRRLMLIDIDPKRGECMSSDEELSLAREMSVEVREYMCSLGFGEPIVMCSGSGYHLLYLCVPQPTTDEYCEGIRYLLSHLAEKFDTPRVQIDQTVFNAARISRLPGMWNRKGPDDTEKNRPHRLAYVVQYPEQWTPTNVGAIAKHSATNLRSRR